MPDPDQQAIERFIRERGITVLPEFAKRPVGRPRKEVQPKEPGAVRRGRPPGVSLAERRPDLKSWQLVYGMTRKPEGGTLSRFVGTSHHRNLQAATLPGDHDAITGATTLFPLSVRHASDSPRLLVSGHNSAKIGKTVMVGIWKGMPIYHLTLVERETCPKSCFNYRQCYGNAMPIARRHTYDQALVWLLGEELRAKAVEHPGGFVVRLHNLGDFPDPAYAKKWLAWMREIPAIRVFGYTAHPAGSPVGKLIGRANEEFPGRWMVRFSVPPDAYPQPMQATTIWRQPEGGKVPEGTVCPMSREKTRCCATCGLCWWPAAADLRIVFTGHGARFGNKSNG